MGILNVTPDSFSDGGLRADPEEAIRDGLLLAAEGADIIDIGGESTRPGAAPVPSEVEQARILPVVRALSASIPVSVDTRHAATMRAALDAGARIINDVSGLTHDPAAAPLVTERGCPVVLMHMRGTPATMNTHARYQDVIAEVRAELGARVDAALAAGIAPEAIVLDPGIGFAKHAEHSLAILRGLPTLASLGYPLLVGVSRKRFIGTLADEPEPARRLGGSLAAGLFAIANGASVLRVHDVRETIQAIRVWQVLANCDTVSYAQIRKLCNDRAGGSNK
ncbi:MAG TPA: dihydropteroate synthase [Rhodopila sp.]|nr:dihydropteroate synthase [Rhodopila sp.]